MERVDEIVRIFFNLINDFEFELCFENITILKLLREYFAIFIILFDLRD